MGLCAYALDITNEIEDYGNVPDFHVDNTCGRRRIKYRCPFTARTSGDFCEFHDQNIGASDKSVSSETSGKIDVLLCALGFSNTSHRIL